MKYLAKTIYLLLVIPCLLSCQSISSSDNFAKNKKQSNQVAVTPYDSNFLWNLKQGRELVAQGRFELAKEHFLYALASCTDDASRGIVTHELNAVNLMIQTQR